MVSNVLLILLCIPLISLPASSQADERRRSGTDTDRHSSVDRHDRSDHRSGAGAVRGAWSDKTAPRDPAVEYYWSNKCVQQRARGWGHTGDCDSPAYTGGSRDLYRGYPRHNRQGQRRYPGGEPVIIVPANSGGVAQETDGTGRSGFSGGR